MAEIMSEGDRFGEVFIETQRATDIARDGGDFNGVGEAGAQMISGAVEKYLGFVFETTEGAGMNDAIAIALVFSAKLGWRLRVIATSGIGAELSIRRQGLLFDLFEFLERAGHEKAKDRDNRKVEM
jgi:hypothetical protein